MRKLLISELRPGMVVGRDICNESGSLMLGRGVVLTTSFIEALAERGFAVIPILDGVGDEIEPPKVLSDQLRMATTKHLYELFNISASPADSSGRQTTRGTSLAIAEKIAAHTAQLSRDVGSIVDEVLNSRVVDGVISLKSHDNYTYEHSIEVTIISLLLGRRLGLLSDRLSQLALGALLHDIGKLSVPASILKKRGRLSSEELGVVKQHPQVGYELMRTLFPYDNILARHVVHQHHERQDGSGYPQKLRGRNNLDEYPSKRYRNVGYILPVAEVAALADVYSALASDRPYRRAMTNEDICDLLQELAGTHLNRDVVKCFLSICPRYPIGSDVTFTAGELRGYRGVVNGLDGNDMARPIVHVLFDPNGERITSFDVDTSKDETAEFVSSHKVLVQTQSDKEAQ